MSEAEEKSQTPTENKYFIITVGATGSGKSILVKNTLKVLELDPELKYERILIDDLIENNKYYKEEVKKIIDEECKQEAECFEKKFEEPSKELFDKFDKAYWNTRGNKKEDKNIMEDQKHCCDNDSEEATECVEEKKMTCDNYSDLKLKKISTKKN